ncbi:hypothetical protein FIU83_07495 [Halomonas sp. THAF5a]|uniref:hypothetical protein n=1 Tax=Halomonas sp. THAF5a TaxID=2587844 RepID=UPI001268C5D5|nr:hypothetical protein [Halomonas sp. THAF5a]QFU01482.1 hypothetical protein FIU83_07495 [Halomonas sp. THAF5a]
MITRWMRKGPVHCWVIKQIDETTSRLHLCESGQLETQLSRKETESQLARGEYRGGLRIGDTGIVLNSELFGAQVPWPALLLGEIYQAHWQGRTWEVSRVPHAATLLGLGGSAGLRMPARRLARLAKYRGRHTCA